MYVYIFFHIIFLYGLSQDIEYSYLCYTIGPVVYLFYNGCHLLIPKFLIDIFDNMYDLLTTMH